MYSFYDIIHFISLFGEKILTLIKEGKYQVKSNDHSRFFENDIRSKIEHFEKEYAQELIDYKIAQDIERKNKIIDLKRKKVTNQRRGA